jgi:hypothetical protein
MLRGALMGEPVRMSLRAVLLLAGFFAFAAAAAGAQRETAVSELQVLPPGVTLPVKLGRSLRAGKVQVGTPIVVTTTQRVPVSEETYLKAGAELDGEVVASIAGHGTASPATLSIQFTRLRYGKQSIPVRTKAIAIANFVQVGYTHLPADGGPDMGIFSEANWTTKQVGGDSVVRTGWVGPVVGSGLGTVGHADYYGVYSLPAPSTDGGPSFPRALGVFSTTADGLYGFQSGTSLRSAGGTITLTGPGKSVELRNGDNLLLEIIASL